VKTIHQRSRGESRIASGSKASNVDASQINCTFFDALGRRDSEYLVARAIQCFVPGIPQVYYVGLLAGCNDVALLSRTGVGRDINRHYYTADELRVALTQPVVQSLLALLQIRSTHPAFQGTFDLLDSPVDRIALVWTNGDAFARLDVDFTGMGASITCSSREARSTGDVVWHTLSGARHDTRCHHVGQHGGRQDAHLPHVRDVRDDDRLGGHHHSRSHQDVPAVADGRRNVSVRDDDRNRAGGPDARAACRSVRSPTDDRHRPHAVRCRMFPACRRRHVLVLRRDAGCIRDSRSACSRPARWR
jgi:hypothetical protein